MKIVKRISTINAKFCGKDLKPIGLDYLYTNVSLELIEYERCNCKESKTIGKM